jgi:putative nucleotidyltransferase with HDIG domain
MLQDRNDAYEMLRELGAPNRLVHHAQLVGEAADLLLLEFQALGLTCDVRTIELGAALHDVGKINHPEELSEIGSLHEQAGQALLLAHGVQPEIARCCASHGAWNLPGVSLEERVVALADKLWKGKREAALELSVIDEIAVRMGVSRWDVFERLDSTFEKIAVGGADRIQQSRPE